MDSTEAIRRLGCATVHHLSDLVCKGRRRVAAWVLLSLVHLVVVVGCGELVRSTGFEEPSISFSGLKSLKERPDGSWLLEWDAVVGLNITYEVFSREFGEGKSLSVGEDLGTQYDFERPVGKTTEGYFLSDNLLLKNNTCFLVRARNPDFADANNRELCTGNGSKVSNISRVSPPVFNSLSLINGASDGRLNVAEIAADQTTVALDALGYMYAKYSLINSSESCISAEGYNVGIPKASDYGLVDGTRKKVCVKLQNLKGEPVYGESDSVIVATSLPLMTSVQFSDSTVNMAEKMSPITATLSGTSNASYILTCLLNCTTVTGSEGVLSAASPGVATAQVLVSGEGVFRTSVKLIDKSGNESSETVMDGHADFSAPIVEIGIPSVPVIPVHGSFSFPVTVVGADFVQIDTTSVHLSGASGCVVSVVNGTTANPIVQMSNCSSAGSVSISIFAGVALDEAGNSSAASLPSSSVTVSGASPVVNNLSLVNGAVDGILNATEAVANQAVVMLDASGFEGVIYSVVDSMVVCDSSQVYSPTFPLAGSVASGDGTTKKVCLKLTNSLGTAVYWGSPAIAVDKTAPTLGPVTVINIGAGNKLNAAHVASGLPILEFVVAAGETASYAIADTSAQCNGALSYSPGIPATSHAGFVSGSTKVVCIQVVDSAGNRSFGFSPSVSIDSQIPSNPVITVAALSDSMINIAENPSSGFAVNVFGEANAGYSLSCTSNCSVVSGGTIATGGSSSTGNLSGTGLGNFNIKATSSGSFAFSVVVSDAFGNASSSVSTSGTAQLTPPTSPVLVMSALGDGKISSAENSSPINVMILDGPASSSYTLTCVTNCIVRSGGSGSLDEEGSATPTIQVFGDGGFGISASVRDAFGNTSSATLSGTADLTAPASPNVAAAALIDGYINVSENTAGIPVTIEGETNANYTLSCATNCTVLSGGVGNLGSGGSVTATVRAIMSGAVTFSVTLRDAVANSSPVVVKTATAFLSAPSLSGVDISDSYINDTEKINPIPITITGTVGANYTLNCVSKCMVSSGGSGVLATGSVVAAILATHEGSFQISVVASDVAGNTSSTVTRTSIADFSKPTVNISSPSVISVGASGAVTYTLTFADSGGSSLSPISLTSSSIVVGGTAFCSTKLITSPTASTRNVTLSGCSGNGTVDISVAAGAISDAAGNVSILTGPSTSFGVDSTPPTLTVTTPVSSTPLQSAFTLTGTCQSGTNVSIASAAILSSPVSAACSSGNYSAALSLAGADGNVTLSVSQSDSEGNTASVSHTVIRDTTPPTVSIGAPSVAAVNASGTATFVVSASDTNGISSFSLSSVTLTKSGTADCTAVVSGSGLTSRSVTLSSCSGNGTVAINVPVGIATDNAGNTSLVAGPSASVTVVTAPPSLTFTVPLNNAQKNAGSFTIEGTCTPALTIVITSSDLSQQSVTGTCSSAGVFQIPIELAGSDGLKTFLATSFDAMGQVSSASRSFIKDTLAPVVVISAPSASAAHTSSTISYSISFTDANGVANVSLTDVSVQTTGSAACSKALTSNGINPATLTFTHCTGDGTIQFTVPGSVAADTAGNSSLASNASSTFVVDNSPPILSVTSPTDGSTFSDSNVSSALTGTCESGLVVTLLGDVNSGQTATCSGGSFAFTSFTLTSGPGSKSVYVRQIDALGNVGNSPSRSFTLQSANGSSSSRPAYSCKEVKNATPSAPSGLYWINVNGTAQQLYCDNITDSGGWTRWVKQTNSRSGFRVDTDSGSASSSDFVLSSFRVARAAASIGGDNEYLFKMDGETYTLKASSMFSSSSQSNISLTILNGASTIANYLPSGSWPSVVHEENGSPVCREWGRFRYPSNSYPTNQFAVGSYTYRTNGGGSWCSDWCGQSGAMTYSFQILPYMYKNEYCYSGSSAGNYDFVGNTIDIYLREKGSGSDPLGANLILAMPFSDSATEDISGAGLAVSVNGTFSTSNAKSKFYSVSGLSGNSSSDSIRVSGSNGLHWYLQSQWTAEGWIWATPGSAFQFISSADGGSLFWWGISSGADGSISWGGWTVGPTVSAPAGSVPFGQWVHWAASRNGNALATWINGTRVAYNSNASWSIGSNMGYINFSGTGNASYPLYRQDHRIYSALKYDPASSSISVPAALK